MFDICFVVPKSDFLINDTVMPPLGILYLSSQLKAEGYSVQCLDFALGHTKEMIDSDIVGVSFTTPQRNSAYELARQLRSEGKIVIAGGPHPTHMPNECLNNGFHCVVIGEADDIMSEVLRDVQQKQFETCYVSNEPKISYFPDRLALPMLSYSYKINERPATVIMTSRGCPFSCTFCSKTSKKFRMFPPEYVLDEIYYLHNEFEYSAFMIFDDVFVADTERLETIVGVLRHEDFLFRCFGRANLLTRHICSLLQEMGVVEVGIGIESGADEILRKNFKGTTRLINTTAIRTLREFGIRSKAFLIVGLPGETEETVIKTKTWIEEAKPDDIDISILQPMPGSVLFNNPEKYGIKFRYDENTPLWYKGKPSEYKTTCSTDSLTAERIVELRNEIEEIYKDKNLLR